MAAHVFHARARAAFRVTLNAPYATLMAALALFWAAAALIIRDWQSVVGWASTSAFYVLYLVVVSRVAEPLNRSTRKALMGLVENLPHDCLLVDKEKDEVFVIIPWRMSVLLFRRKVWGIYKHDLRSVEDSRDALERGEFAIFPFEYFAYSRGSVSRSYGALKPEPGEDGEMGYSYAFEPTRLRLKDVVFYVRSRSLYVSRDEVREMVEQLGRAVSLPDDDSY